MKKKIPIITALAGAAAVCVYRVVKGYGVFNRFKYANEHIAVSRYVETHHPGGSYSSIAGTGDGYSTIITDSGNKFILTVTMAENGIYVFSEEKL